MTNDDVIIDNTFPTVDFFDWCRENDFTVELNERSHDIKDLCRYYASIPGIEIYEGGQSLRSPLGNGDTKLEAINDLIVKLSGKQLVYGLVYGAYSRDSKSLYDMLICPVVKFSAAENN